MLKNIYNISLSSKLKDPHKKSNSEVRSFWQGKKEKLRVKIAILFSAINIIGLEIAAPNYSLSREISTYFVSRSETLKDFANYWQVLFSSQNAAELSVVFHDPIKYAILAFIIILLGFVIVTMDPFSNVALLRELGGADRKAKWWKPWERDLKFYASFLPSNILPTRCHNCESNSQCENALNHGNSDKTLRWNTLVAHQDSSILNDLLSSVNQFRKVYFLKYGVFFSALFLTATYLIVRGIEFLLDLRVYYNFELIAYILILLFVFTVLSFASRTKSSSNGGVCQSFRQEINRLANSPSFNFSFERYVCDAEPLNDHFGVGKRSPVVKKKGNLILEEGALQLKSVITQLDQIVYNKAFDAIVNGLNRQNADRACIRRILEKVVDLFDSIYREDSCFRVCLFIPDKTNSFMRPWVWANSGSKCVIEIQGYVEKMTEEKKEFFSLDGSCIVAQAWNSRKPLSVATKIPELDEIVTPESIMAYPVLCENNLMQLATDKSIDMPETFGVMCIASNNQKVFSAERDAINKALLEPFVRRIAFESILAYVRLVSESREIKGSSYKKDSKGGIDGTYIG